MLQIAIISESDEWKLRVIETFFERNLRIRMIELLWIISVVNRNILYSA
jgi:hypothetical protein